jgi:hypothetical protein
MYLCRYLEYWRCRSSRVQFPMLWRRGFWGERGSVRRSLWDVKRIARMELFGENLVYPDMLWTSYTWIALSASVATSKVTSRGLGRASKVSCVDTRAINSGWLYRVYFYKASLYEKSWGNERTDRPSPRWQALFGPFRAPASILNLSATEPNHSWLLNCFVRL